MSKIRADLVGVVMAGGHNLVAGQDIPEGVDVHETLVEASAGAESNEEAGETSGPTEAAPDAGDGKEDTAEDYSDLLGDDDAPKTAPKAPARGGRKSASTKRG